MPAASVPAVRPDPVLVKALAVPSIRQIEFGDKPLAELVDRQIRVGIEGDGRLVGRTLVAQTQGAAKLLAKPEGEQMVRDLLAVADARTGQAQIKTLALATGKDGYAANTAAAALVELSREWQDKGAHLSYSQWMASKAQTVADIGKDFAKGAEASYFPAAQEMQMGPGISRFLTRYYDEPSLSASGTLRPKSSTKDRAPAWSGITSRVLNHEIEHAITPAREGKTKLDERRRAGLDEGTAEALARWPGQTTATRQQLRLPDGQEDYWTYPNETATVRRLLRLAGVNTRASSDYDRASQLLQSTDISRVPGNLARAIIERHNLSPQQYETLRRRIRDTFVNPTPEQVEKISADYGLTKATTEAASL